eukprot:TRINITY_DN159_c0_g1_i1.p1 TRINITY_DN159_c0_g1~~TRINITY_DN159_c0_g1_i1.p1  ORF type:complete len:628 (+),score=69.83 TRINITY_DN159_c0_g1_i1:486-2369(+)
MDILRNWLPKVGPGLVKIACADEGFDDDFLLALSASASAQTLKKIDVSAMAITDASAAAWSRFSNFEHLDISNCERVTIDTLRSVSLITSLRTLITTAVVTVEQSQEILVDRLPELEKLEIDIEGIEENGESEQQALATFRHRADLKSLLGLRSPPYSFLIALHKMLPDLTYLSGDLDENVSLTELLTTLQYCPGLRWLNLLDITLHDITPKHVQQIASSCPSLENLFLESECDISAIGSDFSIFSSLRLLQLSCNNIHKITKLPPTLEDLSVCEASSSDGDDDSISVDERGLFIDSICKLTNLKYLSIIVNAQFITPSTFGALTHALTNLQQLALVQHAPAANHLVRVPLRTLPFLRHLTVEVPHMNIDPDMLYLPAVSSMTEDANYSLPRVRSASQLPNLANLQVGAYDHIDWLAGFGPQLWEVVSPRKSLALSAVCSFSNLSSLSIPQSLSQDEISQILNSLPHLDKLDAVLARAFPSFEWMKHPRVSTLHLRWPTDRADEIILAVTSQNTPSLRVLELYLHDNSEVKISLSNLLNLKSVYIKGGDTRGHFEFEMDNCPCAFEVRVDGMDIASVKIQNVKSLRRLDLSAYLPPLDQVFLSAPMLEPIGEESPELLEIFALNKRQ